MDIPLLDDQREGHPHQDLPSLIPKTDHKGPVVAVRQFLPRHLRKELPSFRPINLQRL